MIDLVGTITARPLRRDMVTVDLPITSPTTLSFTVDEAEVSSTVKIDMQCCPDDMQRSMGGAAHECVPIGRYELKSRSSLITGRLVNQSARSHCSLTNGC
jgi:hypothetical protein